MREVPISLPESMRALVDELHIPASDLIAVTLTIDPAKASKATPAGYQSEVAFSGSIEFLDHDPLIALAFTEGS